MDLTTFNQFRRFSTDAYGLERLLRLIQAATQILLSLIATYQRPLIELSARLGIARRFFRLFRFLDAFQNAYNNVAAASSPERGLLEQTLECMANTFNGMYLLLESMTIIDALRIPGLAPWGPEREHFLKLESQRCWFLALVAGAFLCVVRLTTAYQKSVASPNTVPAKADRSTEANGPSAGQPDTVVSPEASQMREHSRQSATLKSTRLASPRRRIWRKLAVCVLDMAIPGSILGLTSLAPLYVSVMMLITSVLSGWDFWEKCENVPRVI